MGELSFVVPAWMNWLSLPILTLMLLSLNYCAAVWLQPTHVPSIRKGEDATTKDIFVFLTIFSVMGAFFGVVVEITNISFVRAILVEALFLAFFLWALLPKKLWLVAIICYQAAFFIGEIIIAYNAVLAGLMTIAMVIIILIMAITIGPLRLIKIK